MAQTLRSQTFAQLDRDVTNGINSFNSALNEISKAKQAYDQGFYEKIQMQMGVDSEEFEKAAMETQDPDQLKNLQAQYESKMQNYVNSLKAPKTVRENWESTIKREYTQNLKKTAASTEEPRLWNNAKKDYNSQAIAVVQNGDLTYTQKKEEISRLYELYNMADAPYKIVGYVNTAEDYLKAGESEMLLQSVDRYYAKAGGLGTTNDFDKYAFADQVISEFETESGQTFDVSTKSAYKKSVLEKIEQEENAVQESVNELIYQNITIPKLQSIADGYPMTPRDEVELIKSLGGIDPETGMVNKYFAKYIGNISEQIVAINDLDRVMAAISPNVDVENEWDKAMAEFGTLPVEMQKEYARTGEAPETPEPPNEGSWFNNAIDDDGYFSANDSVGKKDYKFSDGTTMSTMWEPRVEYAMKYFHVSPDSEEAVKAIINRVNLEGMNGAFEDQKSKSIVEELNVMLRDPDVTLAAYQTKLSGYIRQGFLTEEEAKALGLFSPDTKKFTSSQNNPNYSNIKKDAQNRVEGLRVKSKLAGIGAGKKSGLSTDEQIELDHVEQAVIDELERMFNANPSIFADLSSKEYADAMDSAVNRAVHSEMLKKVDKAFSMFYRVFNRNGVLESENETISSLVHSAYDSEDINFGFMNRFVDAGMQTKINKAYGNQLDKGKDYKNQTLNAAAQEVFGKKFSELNDTEKSQIELGLTIAAYEITTKNTIIYAFGQNEGDLEKGKFIIDGVGPAWVNTNKESPDYGKYFCTDGDPSSVNRYLTGKLTESQIKEITGSGMVTLQSLQDNAQTVDANVRRVSNAIVLSNKTGYENDVALSGDAKQQEYAKQMKETTGRPSQYEVMNGAYNQSGNTSTGGGMELGRVFANIWASIKYMCRDANGNVVDPRSQKQKDYAQQMKEQTGRPSQYELMNGEKK